VLSRPSPRPAAGDIPVSSALLPDGALIDGKEAISIAPLPELPDPPPGSGWAAVLPALGAIGMSAYAVLSGRLLVIMLGVAGSAAAIIVAIAVVYSPRVARVVRGSVLVIRETTYVEAARALGVGDVSLIARHVLPNCLSPVIVQGSFVFAAAVLTEAALSFLGVGVPPYVPSWGVILAEGRLYIQQAPWLVLYPGTAIMLTIFGLNLFGDGLRDVLDPKIRGLATERQRAA